MIGKGGVESLLIENLLGWMGRFGAGRVVDSQGSPNGMMVTGGKQAVAATVVELPNDNPNLGYNLEDVSEHGTIELCRNGRVAASVAGSASAYTWTADAEWDVDPGA
jgi:hypothetical protein